MKFLYFVLFLTASLYLNTSFAATVADCDNLLKSGPNYDILKLKDLSPSQMQKLIECGSPEGAKTQPISPFSIFQLITNYITYMAIALSIIAAIVSVIQIATSAGDKTKYQNATELLKNSALAFIISLTVYTILTISLNLIGFETPEDPTIALINSCTASSTISGQCATALGGNYTSCVNKIPTYTNYCIELFCQVTPRPAACPRI